MTNNIKCTRETGYYIRLQRKARKIRQQALAEAIGISRSFLSAYENGQYLMPSHVAELACAAMGIDPAELTTTPPVEKVEGAYRYPDGLREFGQSRNLSERDMIMLSLINYHGKQPTTSSAWRHLWDTIRFICRGNDDE